MGSARGRGTSSAANGHDLVGPEPFASVGTDGGYEVHSRPDLAKLRAEYPLTCPNCDLWLTAQSRDCPRCMTKFTEQGLEAMRRAAGL